MLKQFMPVLETTRVKISWKKVADRWKWKALSEIGGSVLPELGEGHSTPQSFLPCSACIVRYKLWASKRTSQWTWSAHHEIVSWTHRLVAVQQFEASEFDEHCLLQFLPTIYHLLFYVNISSASGCTNPAVRKLVHHHSKEFGTEVMQAWRSLSAKKQLTRMSESLDRRPSTTRSRKRKGEGGGKSTVAIIQGLRKNFSWPSLPSAFNSYAAQGSNCHQTVIGECMTITNHPRVSASQCTCKIRLTSQIWEELGRQSQ